MIGHRLRRAAVALALLAGGAAHAPVADAHYIYTCDGFRHDPATRTYVVPGDCEGDPHRSPATHQWITRRAPEILDNDGKTGTAAVLRSQVPGAGHSHLEEIVAGNITADTGLNGCTEYGRRVGWPLGDHMLNPHRGFGVWSYADRPVLGWQGVAYADTLGRTTACADAPRVRTNSASMADEFFGRAAGAWRSGRRRDAMHNLGIAVHVLQDATVPSHAHPEVLNERLRVRVPGGGTRQGLDAYPAWANVHKDEHRATSRGLYVLPSDHNGVQLARSPGGWVYWMAADAYPYFPWSGRWSAIPRSEVRCDVADFPQECANASSRLLRQSQRVTAGFIEYFFRTVVRAR